tara:strand:- start:19946 stop:21151 length:1206 start_codon:yes stop_codon:yes gene_type:complete
MAKSPDAFRTISEVADWLGIQAHVLRFWESKFTQVKPIKRAGGRRYYRPADMLLLGGIKKLLHDDGLTIKGVQKILREEGMNYVSDLSASLDELTLSELGDPAAAQAQPKPVVPKPETGVVLTFDTPTATATAPEPEHPAEPPRTSVTIDFVSDDTADAPQAPQIDEPLVAAPPQPPQDTTPTASPDPLGADSTEDAPRLATPAPDDVAADHAETDDAATDDVAADDGAVDDGAEPRVDAAQSSPEPAPQPDTPKTQDAAPAPKEDLPAFLRQPLTETPPEPAGHPTDNTPPDADPVAPPDAPAPTEDDTNDTSDPEPRPAETHEPDPVAAEPAPPKPRILDLPPLAAESDFAASPAALSAAWNVRSLPAENIPQIATLLKQLTALRDQMSARRNSPAAKS